MEEVKDDLGAAQTAQFDFRRGVTDSSPFDYLPTTTVGDNGCGSILKGGKVIIETGKCEMSNFYAFITGYSYSALDIAGVALAGGDLVTYMRSIIVGVDGDDAIAGPLTAPVGGVAPQLEWKQPDFSDDTDNTRFIFKTDEDDQDVGLWINYVGPDEAGITLTKIQLSFVHVGIEDYTNINQPDGYPTQGPLTRDEFVFISATTSGLAAALGAGGADLEITNDQDTIITGP